MKLSSCLSGGEEVMDVDNELQERPYQIMECISGVRNKFKSNWYNNKKGRIVFLKDFRTSWGILRVV